MLPEQHQEKPHQSMNLAGQMHASMFFTTKEEEVHDHIAHIASSSTSIMPFSTQHAFY